MLVDTAREYRMLDYRRFKLDRESVLLFTISEAQLNKVWNFDKINGLF